MSCIMTFVNFTVTSRYISICPFRCFSVSHVSQYLTLKKHASKLMNIQYTWSRSLMTTISTSSISDNNSTKNIHKDKQRRPKPFLVIGSHIASAIANREPIVALESTLITHGLPAGTNLKVARRLEEIVASQQINDSSLGVIAATIGVVKGQFIVGLSGDELEYLALLANAGNKKDSSLRSKDNNNSNNHYGLKPEKISRKDLSIAVGLGLSGGTTVAATMALANAVNVSLSSRSYSNIVYTRNSELVFRNGRVNSGGGNRCISVFATGGLGGVHLGGEQSMDVSADLYEFVESPIGVVCAGFKSFLDAKRSLEVLESLGVPVVTLAEQTNTFIGNKQQQNINANNDNCYKDKSPQSLLSLGKQQLESLTNSMASTHKDEHKHELDGKTSELFPGFFFQQNIQNALSPRRVESIGEAAQILVACLDEEHYSCSLWQKRGLLLATPIPLQFALDSRQDLKDKLKLISAKIDGLPEKQQNIPSTTQLPGDSNFSKHKIGSTKTPEILAKLAEVSLGASLVANIALLENNAAIGGQLALHYTSQVIGQNCSLREDSNKSEFSLSFQQQCLSFEKSNDSRSSKQEYESEIESESERHVQKAFNVENCAGKPIVFGATMVDMHVETQVDETFKIKALTQSGATFDGKPTLCLGGVARNLAVALELLGNSPSFVTNLPVHLAQAMSSDTGTLSKSKQQNQTAFAKLALDDVSQLAASGRLMPTKGQVCFSLVLVDSLSGNCEFVVANLDGATSITPKFINESLGAACKHSAANRPSLVLSDANIPLESLLQIELICNQYQVPLFLEPTDVLAARKVAQFLSNPQVTTSQALFAMSPNLIELGELVKQLDIIKYATTHININSTNKVYQAQQLAKRLFEHHLPNLKYLFVTLDSSGVLVATKHHNNNLQEAPIDLNKLFNKLNNNTLPVVTQHFPLPHLVEHPVSASGAGDSFAAALISKMLHQTQPQTLGTCIEFGFRAACVALQSHEPINKQLAQLLVN